MDLAASMRNYKVASIRSQDANLVLTCSSTTYETDNQTYAIEIQNPA